MLADFRKHRFLLSPSPAIPTQCGGVHKMKTTTQPVPLQGDLLIAIIPRAMPWARSYWAFSPYLNHMRKFCKMIYTKQKAMPANSCKHRFYFYNLFPKILLPEILFPEILFPKILLPESLPEGKDFFYPKLSYMMLSGSTPRESR